MFLIDSRSAQVVRIAERHPQLTLIVDHMGVTSDVVKAGKLAGAIDQTLFLPSTRMFPSSCQQLPTIQWNPIPSAIFFRIFGGCSTLMARNVATGGPTSPTVSKGYIPSAHYPFHRGTAVPIGGGQGLDHGTRHCRATRLVLDRTPLAHSGSH